MLYGGFIVKDFLLFIWQLPQHLIGLFIIYVTKAQHHYFINNDFKKVFPYWTSARFNGGVSLGKYIIMQDGINKDTILHERGHSLQSLRIGWLYLILVGIPSAIFNIWDRLFHKKWTLIESYNWYYNRYPEKWADRLGGVSRDIM